MLTKKKITVSTAKNKGYKKIEDDFAFLMQELTEIMRDSDHSDVIKYLPWSPGFAMKAGDFETRIVQAYSVVFQLLNMVEENTANQKRRKIENSEGIFEWNGLWGNNLKKLQSEGKSEKEIASILSKVEVEPVLTAHPTEAKRITILELHRELYMNLVARENTMWTPSELEAIRKNIRSILERLWRTGEIYLTKPSIEMERTGIEYYLYHIFPAALNKLHSRLNYVWEKLGFDLKSLEDNRPRVQFGTWVGGDRDGHPFVTPEVTEQTLMSFRIKALKLHKSSLLDLRAKLSLSNGLQEVPEMLLDGLARQAEIVGSRAEKIFGRNEGEAWRQFVSVMLRRLPVIENENKENEKLSTDHFVSYKHASELREDLMLLRKSLEKVSANRIIEEVLDPTLRQCDTFGFHLTKLDIRQNSGVHERAIAEILKLLGYKDSAYDKWPEEKRVRFLLNELKSSKKKLPYNVTLGTESSKAIGALRVVDRHITRYGNTGIGSIIVSMTRSLSDLLAVYFLAREANLLREDESGILYCPVQVVPLLETVDDLNKGSAIIDEFLAKEITRNSLDKIRQIEGRSVAIQQVMVGYSDSNKDSGILASQCALRSAQISLTKIGKKYDCQIRFFHGRGGTISRGAGPTDRFLEAMPQGTLNYGLRTTEQGEVIAQKYANLLTASYNLELLCAGVTRYSEAEKMESPQMMEVWEKLAKYSSEAYQNLLKEDGFIDFYRQATPIDILEQSRIGSRPSRRSGAKTLDDLRAIPWVFSWSLSRFFLPGWFGVGSALKRLEAESPSLFEEFKKSSAKDPFMSYVFTNVEASMLSVDRDVMIRFSQLVKEDELRERIMKIIHSDLDCADKYLSQFFDKPVQERRPNLIFTMNKRNEALAPLHEYQINLINQWRESDKSLDDPKGLDELLLSVNAIASGLKMTG